MDATPSIKRMQARITDEVFRAMGSNPEKWPRKILGWFFYLPTRKCSRLFVRANQAAAQEGIPGGCRSLLKDLRVPLAVQGREHLPLEGPLLIVANNPGATDSACLGAGLSRGDLKLIVSETGFYHTLPAISPWLIQVGKSQASRMLALREAIAHLHGGGAVLTFGSGLIEPDPALGNGKDVGIKDWSPALGIMLRKAPETRLVLAIVSGVLLPRFANHPLCRIRQDSIGQRRWAGFLQVIWHLLFPWRVAPRPRVSFAPPVMLADLQAEGGTARVMPRILARAEAFQAEHLAHYVGR